MLAARITLAHLSVSSALSIPRSAGVPGKRHSAQIGKPGLNRGSARAGIDLPVEPIDDFGRCILRRADAKHNRSLHSLERIRRWPERPAAPPNVSACVTPSARSLPALMYSIDVGIVSKHDLHLSGEQIGQGGPPPRYGT